MPSHKAAGSYVVVSPVKDEEKYIETTINAVLRQTITPARWVIVDDGSQDKTTAIISRYVERIPWIRVLRIDRDGKREPGSGVIRAFTAGYQLLQDVPSDFIVKLDCDLDLPPNYFQDLIERFAEDDRLGIASGAVLENHGNGWLPAKVPAYHARGASKVVRTQCFKDIGGLVPSPGWDTIDEIRAQMAGWRTRHFDEIQVYHLKNLGSGTGLLRTNLMHGEVYHLTGGGALFFLFKTLHRFIFGRPFLFGGMTMLFGFLRARLTGRQRLVNESEARFYRQLLNGRIINALALAISWTALKRTFRTAGL